MRRLDGNASVRLLDQCPELETPGQRSDRILRIDDLLLGLCRGESADLCGPVRHGRISEGRCAGGRGERTRRCTNVFRFGFLVSLVVSYVDYPAVLHLEIASS